MHTGLVLLTNRLTTLDIRTGRNKMTVRMQVPSSNYVNILC